MNFKKLIEPFKLEKFLLKYKNNESFIIKGHKDKFSNLITLEEIEYTINNGCCWGRRRGRARYPIPWRLPYAARLAMVALSLAQGCREPSRTCMSSRAGVATCCRHPLAQSGNPRSSHGCNTQSVHPVIGTRSIAGQRHYSVGAILCIQGMVIGVASVAMV